MFFFVISAHKEPETLGITEHNKPNGVIPRHPPDSHTQNAILNQPQSSVIDMETQIDQQFGGKFPQGQYMQGQTQGFKVLRVPGMTWDEASE